ncbi:MAG: DUF2892 domain-containing protein [Proteobacteria bacterium]|nr:DUF2892 domain-containing protein [Pseudomonadota bacterium]
MIKNIGSIDKVIRIILGLGLISLYFLIEGPHRWWSIAGVVLIATVALNFCPIYKIIRFKGTAGK